MDKFFEKLFAKIADFHQRETELSQSLVDNNENLPYWLFEENQKHDFYLSEFLWANKKIYQTRKRIRSYSEISKSR